MKVVKPLTWQDFHNFYSRPKAFWFLNKLEVETLLSKDEQSHEPSLEDLFDISDMELCIWLFTNKCSSKKLKKDFLKKLKISDNDFYDFSKKDNALKDVKDILKTSDTCLIYFPKLSDENFLVDPTAIYKVNGCTYLFKSSSKATSAIIFYEFVLTNFFEINIDGYLFLTLDKPTYMNRWTPIILLKTSASHKKLPCNINHLLKKINDATDLSSDSHEEEIVPSNWGDAVYDVHDIRSVISELKTYQSNPVNFKMDVDEFINWFIKNQTNLIKPDKELSEKILRHHYGYKYSFSGNLINFKKLVVRLSKLNTTEKRSEFLESVNVFKHFSICSEGKDAVITNRATKDFIKFEAIKAKVFYDFETSNLPIPFSVYPPHKQIVLQASIIKTDESLKQATEVINLVFDPQSSGEKPFDPIKTCKTIIDSIHSSEIDACYVVYNKSFENTCLKYMKTILERDEDKTMYGQKIDEIIEKTVDLADWFRVSNNHQMIIIKQLKAYYSIKKIINLIPDKILTDNKVVKYGDLECADGRGAQLVLNYRICIDNLNNKTEKAWENAKNHLIRYCENDVRVMIATYHWMKELFDQQNNID